MEGNIWTDHQSKEEVQRDEEEMNVVQTMTIRKDTWIGHTWHRNCLTKYVIEGET
jgi:hypothetical protein